MLHLGFDAIGNNTPKYSLANGSQWRQKLSACEQKRVPVLHFSLVGLFVANYGENKQKML